MNTNEWVTSDTPQDRLNSARIYDYLLGGYHNFEIDRLAAEKYIAAWPDARLGAQANRAFLRRAVHFCLEQGIDQFFDLGSGIPTMGNVNEIAQQTNPAARVIYVDTDPVAVAHSLAILRDNPNASAVQAAIALENARLFEQARKTAERLQLLSRRLVEVQEEERRHIARELHDEIGQTLTGLTLLLEWDLADGRVAPCFPPPFHPQLPTAV